RLRIRATVVAVVDAVAVVIQVCAARRNRSRGNRGHSLGTQRNDHADRSQQVAKPVFAGDGDALVVEVTTVGQFGTHTDAAHVGLQTGADLGGQVAVFALTRGVRARERVELFFRALVAQAHQQVRVPVPAFSQEVVTRVQRDAVL